MDINRAATKAKEQQPKQQDLNEQLNSLQEDWDAQQKKSKQSRTAETREKFEKKIKQQEEESAAGLDDIFLSRDVSDEAEREREEAGNDVNAEKQKSSEPEKKEPAKKKVNRNDAAAEQWARFYEQHGEEVASQHGYTKAHYEQYLRRGGTPGGEQSF